MGPEIESAPKSHFFYVVGFVVGEEPRGPK